MLQAGRPVYADFPPHLKAPLPAVMEGCFYLPAFHRDISIARHCSLQVTAALPRPPTSSNITC